MDNEEMKRWAFRRIFDSDCFRVFLYYYHWKYIQEEELEIINEISDQNKKIKPSIYLICSVKKGYQKLKFFQHQKQQKLKEKKAKIGCSGSGSGWNNVMPFMSILKYKVTIYNSHVLASTVSSREIRGSPVISWYIYCKKGKIRLGYFANLSTAPWHIRRGGSLLRCIHPTPADKHLVEHAIGC